MICLKKVIAVILLAIVTGVAFSLFIFSKYEEKEVSKEINKIYFVQQGVYSNYNNMQKNTEKLEAYTFERINEKYYVYVCFTTSKENLNMIEKYFKSLNYSIYIKEKEITDYRFLEVLNQYDYLMSKVEKGETIKNICKQLVHKYEEYK